MKKILAILLIFLAFSSCVKLEDLNKNTKDFTAVSGESLFTRAQKSLFDELISTNVNQNNFRMYVQYWTETTYIDEANYDVVTRSIPDNFWNVMYRDVLNNLKYSAKIIGETAYPTDASPAVKANRLAVVDIMAVFTWSVLVQTFGDIPYTEALNVDNPLPKYDDGLTVYKALLTRLDEDISTLDPAYGSLDGDNMYQGDVGMWLKFANSLKLRMGLVLADLDPAYAKTIVEAAAPGVFTSNADNGQIFYLGSQPNTNPLYVDLVASGRNDFVITETLIDTLNGMNDPRRPFFMTFAPDTNAYIGGVYGASNDFTKYSHVGDRLEEPTFEGTIIDYAEVEFSLAEAVERGFNVGGTAESHYNAGITASIDYWSQGTVDPSTYLSTPAVAYSTAAGDWKQKIGFQKWIALYNRGFDAWTEWRRLDNPVLYAPASADPFKSVPVRLTYPVAEQTLNGANRSDAATAIGGDALNTLLFWDLTPPPVNP